MTAWMLPDPPVGGTLDERRDYLTMLRSLEPRTPDVKDAIAREEQTIARLESETRSAA